MTTPDSTHAPSSWRGDPDSDFVIYRLIEMERNVLGDFSDDERVAEYQDRGRRAKGRKPKAASSNPETLGRWRAEGRFQGGRTEATLRYLLRTSCLQLAGSCHHQRRELSGRSWGRVRRSAPRRAP